MGFFLTALAFAPDMVKAATPPKIVVFAGSSRHDSFNKKLAREAAQLAAGQGVEVEFIDLKDYPMPIYDGDLEEAHGLPPKAKELKTLFRSAQGFLIASPEYNSAPTSLLLNALDWLSRSEGPEEKACAVFAGKPVALAGASPGGYGAARSLRHLRAMVEEGLSMKALEDQVTVGKAHTKFDAQGKLTDQADRAQLTKVVNALIAAVKAA